MSQTNELQTILELFKKQQQQIDQLFLLFPKKEVSTTETADLVEQGRVVEADENEEQLLEIEPLPSSGTQREIEESLDDVQEELVEEDVASEPEFVQPVLKKDNSLVEEVLDEGAQQAGNRQCLRVAFSTAPRKNRFKDNPSFAKLDTLAFDKKVRTEDSIKAHRFIEKRPPAVKVVVRCRECSRKFKIDSRLAPQRLDREDVSTYQCDGCILRRKG